MGSKWNVAYFLGYTLANSCGYSGVNAFFEFMCSIDNSTSSIELKTDCTPRTMLAVQPKDGSYELRSSTLRTGLVGAAHARGVSTRETKSVTPARMSRARSAVLFEEFCAKAWFSSRRGVFDESDSFYGSMDPPWSRIRLAGQR